MTQTDSIMTTDTKIIVALDFADLTTAKALVAKLDPKLCKVKVGKEMFTLFGPSWVDYLTQKGFQVFLDLKFHDIPNTVAKACQAAAQTGAWMINVHASGGEKMMSAAAEALQAYGQARPLLTAVTVLTSMDEAEYIKVGYAKSLAEQVLHLASLAKRSGLDGVVCSALEATSLRAELGDDFTLVTPGIRLQQSVQDDQSRVMTPQAAIKAGASYLVIGRPITQSPDPLKTLNEITETLLHS